MEMDSLLDTAHREIESGERPHEELLALRKGLAVPAEAPERDKLDR